MNGIFGNKLMTALITLKTMADQQSAWGSSLKLMVMVVQCMRTVLDASTETEYDYLCSWIKNGHIRKNLTQNGEPQRYSWETQKKKKSWLQYSKVHQSWGQEPMYHTVLEALSCQMNQN